MFDKAFPDNCGAYEIMWKNMIRPDRTQMTMQENTSRVFCMLDT